MTKRWTYNLQSTTIYYNLLQSTYLSPSTPNNKTKKDKPDTNLINNNKKTTTTDPKSKALAAKKAALKGTSGVKTRKVRTSTSFHRPKTLRLNRVPKYPRKSVPKVPALDAYKVVKFPLNTESAMKKIEENNTLVFVCDVRSNKHQIKEAVKRLYDVEAVRINTLIR